ncbi:MAG TPA: hypothetical protein VF593_13635, partial [Chthoniobacteraceae bacterium]
MMAFYLLCFSCAGFLAAILLPRHGLRTALIVLVVLYVAFNYAPLHLMVTQTPPSHWFPAVGMHLAMPYLFF